MKFVSALVVVTASLVLGGCALKPQLPVSIEEGKSRLKGARVGVAMSAVPKTNTHFPGAGCLLCMATAEIANASLTTHTKGLSPEDLPKLKADLGDLLRSNGATVTDLPETFTLASLPDAEKKEGNFASKDFSSLGAKYGIDKVVVIDITLLGMLRTYSSYFPTSDPKGALQGKGYLVNLSNNQLEWYAPVNIVKGAEGKWDEPPKFPGLTNAYFQVLELAKDAFLKPFQN